MQKTPPCQMIFFVGFCNDEQCRQKTATRSDIEILTAIIIVILCVILGISFQLPPYRSLQTKAESKLKALNLTAATFRNAYLYK